MNDFYSQICIYLAIFLFLCLEMKRVIQIFFTLLIAVALVCIASVDVSDPVEKTQQEPTAVVDVANDHADCSSCDKPCDKKLATAETEKAEANAVDTQVSTSEKVGVESSEPGDEFKDIVSSSDEFEYVTSDGSEFEDMNNPGSEFEDVTDADSEFEDVSEESTEFETETTTANETIEEEKPLINKSNKRLLVVVFSLFLATALAGIFVNYAQLRKSRYLFLLVSLAIVGFGFGGSCPCMLKSFDNTFLLIMGKNVPWASVVFFIGLIPLTYVFGKVWCGWICHFGALQEFIHKKTPWNILQTYQSQKVLSYIRMVIFVVWVLWLIITQSSYICRYDPFVKIFSMRISGAVGYVLVALLVLLSLFINRPFCRTICPVGFILGLVARLPYAEKLTAKSLCIGCGKCMRKCDKGCISGKQGEQHKINHDGCIHCGECMDECPRKGINDDCEKA